MVKLANLAVLAMTVACGFVAAPANARTVYMVEREYYSDATYTVVVGHWVNTCQGQYRGWGYTSAYYVELGSEACAGPGVPPGQGPPIFIG